MPVSNNSLVALGVDLGGTNFKIGAVIQRQGLVNSQLEVLDFFETHPLPASSPQEAVPSITGTLKDVFSRLQKKGPRVNAIGLGVAGLIKRREGIVTLSPNLPLWKDLPLKAMVEKDLNLPVIMENDANAAAYGEFIFGAGKGKNSLILLTLGTGVGGGMVLNKELWRGESEMAAEIGHMVVDPHGHQCACGSQGCLETFASATAILREARLALDGGADSSLAEKYLENRESLTAEVLARAAQEGDGFAVYLFSWAGEKLGLALAGLINLLNPDVIALAGGMSQAGDLILNPAKKEAQKRAFPALYQSTRIVLSQLGPQAGALGAAALALKALSPQP